MSIKDVLKRLNKHIKVGEALEDAMYRKRLHFFDEPLFDNHGHPLPPNEEEFDKNYELAVENWISNADLKDDLKLIDPKFTFENCDPSSITSYVDALGKLKDRVLDGSYAEEKKTPEVYGRLNLEKGDIEFGDGFWMSIDGAIYKKGVRRIIARAEKSGYYLMKRLISSNGGVGLGAKNFKPKNKDAPFSWETIMKVKRRIVRSCGNVVTESKGEYYYSYRTE